MCKDDEYKPSTLGILSVREGTQRATHETIPRYLPTHPNHRIVMNNPAPRHIRHNFTTYNTHTNNSGPTNSKEVIAFPTSDDCHDNHGRT